MLNSRNLVFFEVVWHEKMLFGMYAISLACFWPVLLVLAEKTLFGIFQTPVSFQLIF